MSQKIGSSIVTDGLVLYYDMSNTKKSFKGQPTVNLVPTPDTMASFSNYWYGPAVAKYFPDLGCSGFTLVNAGSWNGVYKGISLPSAGTYTFSAWLRYHGGSSNNNGGQVYVNGWNGGSDDTASGINKTLVGVWQRVTLTLACTTLSPTMYLISYGGTDGIDYSSWDIAMPQVEAGSIATPFVSGTRSTTNNLIDLTGNNSFTTNSLTYASDNTFSFNNTTNYLSCNSINNGITNFTYSAWVKWAAFSSYGTIFENGLYTAGFLFRFYPNYLEVYSQGTGYGNLAFTPTVGVWYNITIVRDYNTLYIYKNGVSLGSIAFGSSVNVSPGTYMYIGSSQHTTGQGHNGSIATFSSYNRALSISEIIQNFNALRGRFGV